MGGTAARGTVRRFGPQAVARPFARAVVVEGTGVAALPVGAPQPAPDGVGFGDGIQQYLVDGHIGLTPVVRAYVDAAVLERRGGRLSCAARAGAEFLVVPQERLAPAQRRALEEIGLPVEESDPGPRPHPLVDLWVAAQVVERQRAACEREAGRGFLAARPGAWLFVDGGVAGLAGAPGAERAIGVVYRPETERISHYFQARLADQFDAVIHLDETHALEPLEPTSEWDSGELPETYPFGV